MIVLNVSRSQRNRDIVLCVKISRFRIVIVGIYKDELILESRGSGICVVWVSTVCRFHYIRGTSAINTLCSWSTTLFDSETLTVVSFAVLVEI